jgi:hypothetical protein
MILRLLLPLVALSIAGCDLLGPDGTASTSPTGTPVVTAAPGTATSMPTPTAPSASSDVVPVIECPTTYGGQNPGAPSATYPSTIALSISATVAQQLAAYSNDTRSLAPILGPRGWSCPVGVGADGGTSVTILPPSGTAPMSAAGGQKSPPLISAYWPSACMSCVYAIVCPFIPDAAQQLGYPGVPCPSSPPSQETVTFVNGSPTTAASADIQDVIEFTDPPGITGDAGGSGGPDPAEGVVLYDSFSGSGTTGQSTFASQESCALPASAEALCTAIIGDFVERAWLMGG